MDKIPHGTISGYIRCNCRCDACRTAIREYQQRRRGMGVPDGQPHGTHNAYTNYGCRCDACRIANREYEAARQSDPEIARQTREYKRAQQRKWRAAHPEHRDDPKRREREKAYHQAYHLRRRGLTPELLAEMLAATGGRCFICERDDRKMVIDHCHETGRVRGLLCKHWNAALGQFGDDLPQLRRAVLYLDTVQKKE